MDIFYFFLSSKPLGVETIGKTTESIIIFQLSVRLRKNAKGHVFSRSPIFDSNPLLFNAIQIFWIGKLL